MVPVWQAALQLSVHLKFDTSTREGKTWEQTVCCWTSIRAKVKHLFRVIKRKIGYQAFQQQWLEQNIA